MKNEEIFYTHKHNAVVDSSGKQIAIVLPSNCTMREARAMAAFAAQQMNHELRAKKLKKSNALSSAAAVGGRLRRTVRPEGQKGAP